VAAPVLAAARPRQWTKNLLLFAGLVFAAKLGDFGRWAEAVAIFLAYCAASSAAYLVNDVRDAEADRSHPSKRLRPVASGALAPRRALAIAGALAGVALTIAAAIGLWTVIFLLGFLALQAAYTLGLKHVALVDVLTIAGLFVIRAAAGAEAVDVRISPWLLVCTALLALFLALGKRRGELVLVDAEVTPGRRVLRGYSLALVDRLVTLVAVATVIAYSLYTLTARDSKALMVTIPFVVFGLFRYRLLLRRSAVGEEPEHVLLNDVPIIVTVAAWAATCALLLALD